MDSKIDWKKPVQIADGEYDTRGGMPVTVVREDGGNRLIQWHNSGYDCHAMVSEQGKLIATLHTGAAICPGKQQFVVNVPEHVL